MKEKDAANAESQGKSAPVEHKTPFWAEKQNKLLIGQEKGRSRCFLTYFEADVK